MSERPAVPPPQRFALPSTRRIALDAGTRATFLPFGAVPQATVRVLVDTGAARDPAGRTGLAELTSRYLKEGTSELDAEELARRMAGLGGRLDVHVDDDTTTLEAQVLSEAAPDAIRELASVLRRPRLPASEIERLRAELLRELEVAAAQPETIAQQLLQSALYRDHPYGRVLPEHADIDALTVDATQDFAAGLAGAPAEIYVAGRFDLDAAEAAATEAFDGRARLDPPPLPAPRPTADRRVLLSDRPGAEQSTLRLGLPVPDPSHADYLPLTVVNALLGGAFMSRITLNLREDKGYTYSPRSSITTRLRDAYWMQAADVTTEVTGASLHEIFAEIERLRAEPPPAEELAGVQRYVAGGFILRGATPEGVLDLLAFADFHGLGASYIEGYIDRLQAVTPAEVQRLAREYLRPEGIAVAVAGDAARIRDELAPYGEIVEG